MAIPEIPILRVSSVLKREEVTKGHLLHARLTPGLSLMLHLTSLLRTNITSTYLSCIDSRPSIFPSLHPTSSPSPYLALIISYLQTNTDKQISIRIHQTRRPVTAMTKTDKERKRLIVGLDFGTTNSGRFSFQSSHNCRTVADFT